MSPAASAAITRGWVPVRRDQPPCSAAVALVTRVWCISQDRAL